MILTTKQVLAITAQVITRCADSVAITAPTTFDESPQNSVIVEFARDGVGHIATRIIEPDGAVR